MIIKRHLSGVAIAYDPPVYGVERDDSLPPLSFRPQGSLYNQQKRKIADATEWLRLHQTDDRKAVIFCLTSPGAISLASTPRFLSRWLKNMKLNYDLGDYVWVREYTKKGFPHFHFIALWHPASWFFACSECGEPMKEGECTGCYCTLSRINQLSVYWSSLFGSDSKNSIRLGSFHPVTKRRTLYVSSVRQCRYLTKYIGKGLGVGLPLNTWRNNLSFARLLLGQKPEGTWCDAIYLADMVKYKRDPRSFGMSEYLAMYSEPELFETQTYQTATREVMTATGQMASIPVLNLCYIGESGQLERADLAAYEWRWTGHGQTYIGVLKQKTA